MDPIYTEELTFEYDNKIFDLYFAQSKDDETKLGTLLLFPAWDGLNQPIKDIALKMTFLGYKVYVFDLYGKGVRGEPTSDNSHLMNPLLADRRELQSRMLAGFRYVKSIERLEDQKFAAVGYCFGGLCALDLARANPAGLLASISFHGLLDSLESDLGAVIHPKILVLHGGRDPMVPPESLRLFFNEMLDKKADWQMNIYGDAMHAFTFTGANSPEIGVQYSEKADRLSWDSLTRFLHDTFSE
ncbi:dienelactone hydrolase family protein [Alteromonas oceanisediminis]|uniref:dienelactone hydrolase family protein n=1 Tax=Alteromonas oceanisediminis TaxID=2836180 RepID=UPI001BDB2F15|nr:dienelactone hydrolase family protein [Alteromonas oceanisediminis]MBT0587074.1 dienelactone hydrolase family protein [Alteromonas oceanisediminis]